MNEQKQTDEQIGKTPESLRILEAVLFASDEVMSPAKLKTILPDQPDARAIRKMVDEINIRLQQERHPYEIVELGGGYQFRTVPYYQPWVQQLFKDKATRKISIQGLECLAIIAYKQPISKAEIEAIRGVLSDGAMKTLLEKHFINIVGRSDKPGRPLLYGTTQEFIQYFGINKLTDLPKIEEFEAVAKEQVEMFSEESLAEAGILPEPPTEEQPEETGESESAEELSTEEQAEKNSESENTEEFPTEAKPEEIIQSENSEELSTEEQSEIISDSENTNR